jgi:hypothetical protein
LDTATCTVYVVPAVASAPAGKVRSRPKALAADAFWRTASVRDCGRGLPGVDEVTLHWYAKGNGVPARQTETRWDRQR